LTPLGAADRSPDQQELLQSVGGDRALHIFATLARHPGLFRRWLPFGGKLLQGAKLDHRDRELVILRVAWRCQCEYEWTQHVGIAREAGLSDDEIRRVAGGPDAPEWSQDDAALLRAVDELRDDSCMTDSTWAALSRRFNEQQMIEVPMLAGHYAMLAGALNSFGVQPEGTGPRLGEA